MTKQIISALCIKTYFMYLLVSPVSADNSYIPTEIKQRIEKSFDTVDKDIAGKTEIQKIKRYNFIIVKLRILQEEKKNLTSTDNEILDLVKNTANSRVAVLKKKYVSSN